LSECSCMRELFTVAVLFLFFIFIIMSSHAGKRVKAVVWEYVLQQIIHKT